MKNEILFVEDDADDVEMTLLGLKEAGFKLAITVALDGAEALERLEQALKTGSLPVAVVTDLRMAKLGGLDLMRRMRATAGLKSLLVAVLTSSDAASDKKTALELGAMLYLEKPLSIGGYAPIARKLEKMADGLNAGPAISRE